MPPQKSSSNGSGTGSSQHSVKDGRRRQQQQQGDTETAHRPAVVDKQYIQDRVQGNSYVPRHCRQSQRTSWFSCGSCCCRCCRCCRCCFHNRNTKTNNQDDHHPDTIDDYTDCTQRPPHYCCYVAPCVSRWPGCLEQNWLCRCTGAVGAPCCFDWRQDDDDDDDHQTHAREHVRRRRIFSIGLLFNALALGGTTVASMAFTRNYNLLRHASFTRGEAKLLVTPTDNDTTNTSSTTTTTTNNNNNDDTTDLGRGRTVLKIDLGFRAVAVENLLNDQKQVFLFRTFCDGPDLDNDDGNDNNQTAVGEVVDDTAVDIEELMAESVCGECRDSSQAFVVSCLFNLVILVKNLLNDVTRMYPRYDLNCINFTGSLMATLSVFLGLYTVLTYRERCFNNIFQNLDEGRLSQTADLVVAYDWWAGPGLYCLVVATFLRCVDMICNYCVPTPSITRRRKEQRAYEVEYGPLQAESAIVEVEEP